MYFEAEIKRKKYKVEVKESKTHWSVKFEVQGEPAQSFEFSKDDYTKFDDAISFIFEGKSYMVDLIKSKEGYMVYNQTSYRNVLIRNDEKLLHESLKGDGQLSGSDQLTAGMPGKITKIFVKQGQRLQTGAPILIMEAMKMENEMRAAHDCVIKEISVKEGASVDTGAVLVTFESH